jgi:hypothetical protein
LRARSLIGVLTTGGLALIACGGAISPGSDVRADASASDGSGGSGSGGGGSGSGSGSSSGGGSGSSGGGSGSSSSSGGVADAGASGDGATADAAGCTAAVSVTDLPPFVSATASQACTATEIQMAITDCLGSDPSAMGCAPWKSANVPCAACIFPPFQPSGPTGAALCIPSLDACILNVDACVQVADGNTACASADEELTYCTYAACSSATCLADYQDGGTAQSDFAACVTAAEDGACASQWTTWQMACAVDSQAGGSLDVCSVDSVTGVTRLLNFVCNPGNQ